MWDHRSSHMKHTQQGLGVYTRQPEVSISTPVSFRVDTSGPASLPGFPRKVSPFPVASYTSQPLLESRNREITLPCLSPCSTVPPLQFFHSCSDGVSDGKGRSTRVPGLPSGQSSQKGLTALTGTQLYEEPKQR